MGSDTNLITATEAAEILGVSVAQVHVVHRNGLLEALHPPGTRKNNLTGKLFRRDDVVILRDAREQTAGASTARLKQLALQAIVTSRRVEHRLAELTNYLGLEDHSLSLERDDVVALYTRMNELGQDHTMVVHEDLVPWSRQLLGVTAEFLGLVEQHTGDKEPWRVFMRAGKSLTLNCSAGSSARMYVDHACANLRNVAYFYIRGVYGVRVANKMFPKEGYSTELIRTMLPAR